MLLVHKFLHLVCMLPLVFSNFARFLLVFPDYGVMGLLNLCFVYLALALDLLDLPTLLFLHHLTDILHFLTLLFSGFSDLLTLLFKPLLLYQFRICKGDFLHISLSNINKVSLAMNLRCF